MFFTYLGEVLKRAITPTPRLTDGLQIVAASAFPALVNFAGIEAPQGAENSVLAYIGLVALSFFVIRFFWAPYSMWKDQASEISSLKVELAHPERIEHEWIAKRRAKARLRLATLIREFQAASFHLEDKKRSKISRKMIAEHSKISLGGAITAAISAVHELAIEADGLEARSPEWQSKQSEAAAIAMHAQNFLQGRITAEVLALQLPRNTEQKTPQ